MFRTVLCALLLVLAWTILLFGQENTWRYRGTWKEEKYKITGPLEVTVTRLGREKWRATFKGIFDNVPFEYRDIEFSGLPDKLVGSCTLNREQYEWRAVMTQDRFTGSYTSDPRRHGYVGSFDLRE